MVILVGFDDGEMRFNVDFMGFQFQWDLIIVVIYGVSRIRGYIYIYIYTRNAWVLPRRCSVEVSHSQTNDVANRRNSYGENNKGTRDY